MLSTAVVKNTVFKAQLLISTQHHASCECFGMGNRPVQQHHCLLRKVRAISMFTSVSNNIQKKSLDLLLVFCFNELLQGSEYLLNIEPELSKAYKNVGESQMCLGRNVHVIWNIKSKISQFFWNLKQNSVYSTVLCRLDLTLQAQ